MLATTNFSLTYFLVSGEIENSGVPAHLVVVETEGMSVLTAWAAGKFSGAKVAAAVKASGLEDQAGKRRLIIPGYVAQISGEVEEGLPGWEVLVGPGRSLGSRPLPEETSRAVTPCHSSASCPPTSWPSACRNAASTKRQCGPACSTWSCRAVARGRAVSARWNWWGGMLLVLACQTAMTSDLEVRLPDRSQTAARGLATVMP